MKRTNHTGFSERTVVPVDRMPLRNTVRSLAMCAALCFAGAAGVPTSSAQDAARPNVLFILADDLGYGDLGCYGQQRIQTPHLDRLAQEGMRFRQFYAGSTVCAPSRCALMTGLHTGHCFIRGNGKDNLRPQDVTVAQILKQAGYATALIGKWGLGHEGSTGVPTRQGFGYFFGYLDQHHAHNYYPSFLVRNEQRVALTNVVPGEGPFGQGVATVRNEYSHDLLMRDALDFIRRHPHQQQPFFLYLALTIPHANNEAGGKGMEVPDYGPYGQLDWPDPQKGHAAMITRMDRDIGHLLDLLKELDIDRNTVVFFSSDNGPHREGGNDPDFQDSNGPLRGIKRSLHDGGIRVPLMVRWPARVRAGTMSDWVGAMWDVLPTLAELAGAAEKVPQGLDGISFVPELLGQHDQQVQHDYLYWAFYERGGGQAIRQGKWKAVQQPLDKPLELYDIDADIGERSNLADKHPDVAEQLAKLMDQAYSPSERWQFDRRAQSARPNLLVIPGHDLRFWNLAAVDPPGVRPLDGTSLVTIINRCGTDARPGSALARAAK